MRQLFKDNNLIRLCLAAFFMSSCLQLVWVVMPFIIKSMKGSDTEVGLCFMGQMGTYVVFCVITAILVHRLKPKKVLLISAAALIWIICAMYAVIRGGADSKIFFSPIIQLVSLMSLIGVITAFYWPVLMGWVSTGHEGAELTKRFGFYNVTWGMANMLLPIVGGYLMEINYLFPIAVAAIMIVLCFGSVLIVKSPHESEKTTARQADEIAIELNPANRQFVWISRISLFAIFICVGMFRSQLGILYKYELGFTESVYGWSVSLMCLFNVITFYMMGKSYWWHYKKGMFAASQILIVICLITIIFSRNLFIQLLAAGLTGISYGIIYSSHQYYGVSGGKNRSGRMAIHEIILGAGFTTGSLFGGMISDSFGRQWPYGFGCAIIAVAGLVQMFLWFAIGKNNQSSSKPKTSFFTSPT